MKFTEDFYSTPSNIKRCFGDIFSFKTRFYFYLKFLQIIFNANKVAKLGKFNDYEYCKIADLTFRLIENCGGKIHIKGLDNIKKIKGPVVFIGNHMSVLETFILPSLIIPFKPISFVVKESLISHRFFGTIMKATRPISVTRTDPRKDFKSVMIEGQKYLNNGRSIIVFPQSTRGNFVPEEFSSIGDKLAQKAKVPVVPIALKTDFWSNGKLSKDFGRIYRDKEIFFEFAKPLGSEIDKKNRNSKIVQFISEKLKEWNSL